jgi:hypothetical protein
MRKKKTGVKTPKMSTKRVSVKMPKTGAPMAPKGWGRGGQPRLGIMKQLRKKIIGDLL